MCHRKHYVLTLFEFGVGFYKNLVQEEKLGFNNGEGNKRVNSFEAKSCGFSHY